MCMCLGQQTKPKTSWKPARTARVDTDPPVQEQPSGDGAGDVQPGAEGASQQSDRVS